MKLGLLCAVLLTAALSLATPADAALLPPLGGGGGSGTSIAKVTPQYAADRTQNPPVLFVHGVITSPTCSGEDVSKTDASLASMLTAQRYGGPLVGLSYYCGDKGGVSIDNAGAGHCDSWPTQNYSTDTAIERLSCDLAWWIYATYTSSGQPVDIVGHSMGGLIARFALGSVAAADPRFPPALIVNDAVAISAPFLGWDKPCCAMTSATYVAANCGTYAQCSEMAAGSAFLKAMAALPEFPTDWTTIGGGLADQVDTFASSSGIPVAHKVNYSASLPVKYNHTSYLTDTSTAFNEPFQLTQPGGAATSVTGSHSLLLTTNALMSSRL